MLATNYCRSKQMETEEWAGHVEEDICRQGFSGKMRREEKRPLGRPRRSWGDNIKMDITDIGCNHMEWLNTARTGTSGKLLWTQLWTVVFYTVWGISRLAEVLLASQRGLCSMELVSWGRLCGSVLMYWPTCLLRCVWCCICCIAKSLHTPHCRRFVVEWQLPAVLLHCCR
jgi:hypothetical protein